jgi:hypothetical protein
MDNDWKLKQLEEEVRHEKAMRELHAGHLDAHDRSFAAIHDTLSTVATRLDEITVLLNQTAVSQAKTEMMLQDLIATIAREHGNGKH